MTQVKYIFVLLQVFSLNSLLMVFRVNFCTWCQDWMKTDCSVSWLFVQCLGCVWTNFVVSRSLQDGMLSIWWDKNLSYYDGYKRCLLQHLLSSGASHCSHFLWPVRKSEIFLLLPVVGGAPELLAASSVLCRASAWK